MATFHAIEATSQAIVGLLAEACPRTDFPAARFELFQLASLEGATLEEGVSLCLYQVVVNGGLRSIPPRVAADRTRYVPSLPIDLHYLVTAWGRTPPMQQRLLAWCVRTLEDTTVLPQGLLNSYGSELETFRPDETVQLQMDTLSIQDAAALWQAARAAMQLSVAYVARVIFLDSERELPTAEPVQTRVFEVGRVP